MQQGSLLPFSFYPLATRGAFLSESSSEPQEAEVSNPVGPLPPGRTHTDMVAHELEPGPLGGRPR